jgi:hypothetical protein
LAAGLSTQNDSINVHCPFLPGNPTSFCSSTSQAAHAAKSAADADPALEAATAAGTATGLDSPSHEEVEAAAHGAAFVVPSAGAAAVSVVGTEHKSKWQWGLR